MTGHVVQVLLDDDDLDRVLEAAQEHLVPGGALGFDTRNPSAHAWLHWTRRETQRTIETPVAGPVSVWHDTVSVEGEIVALQTSHAFLRSGELTVTTSRLRFRTLDALQRRLAGAGFHDIVAYGDWDGGPVTATSPELIVVARRRPS
jgi:hypothetical protein